MISKPGSGDDRPVSDSTPRPELDPEPEEPKSALPSFPYTPTSAERDGLGPLQSSDLPAPASMQEPAAEAPMALEPGLVLAPSNASEVAAPPPLPKKRTPSKVEEVAGLQTAPEAEAPAPEKSPLDIAPADWEAMLPQPSSGSSALDAAVVDAEELIEVDTDDFVEIQSEEPEEIASAEVIDSVALSDAPVQPKALPSFESPAQQEPPPLAPGPPQKAPEPPEAELPKLESPAAMENLAQPTPAPDGSASNQSDIPDLALGDLQPPSLSPDAFPPPPDSEDEMLASLMADLEIAEPPNATPPAAHAMAPLDENEVVLLDRPKRKTQDLPQLDLHPSGPSAPAYTPPRQASPAPIRTITGTPVAPNAAGSGAHAPAQSSTPQVPVAPSVVPSGPRAPVAPQTVVSDPSDSAPRMRPTIRARPVKERDRRAEILRDQANPHPEAEQYYQLALQALKTQAFEDAEQLLRKALVRSPSNPKITRALDKLKRMLGTP